MFYNVEFPKPVCWNYREGVELLKKYDYTNTEQIWLLSEITPNDVLNGISFKNVFYDILKYFYNLVIFRKKKFYKT